MDYKDYYKILGVPKSASQDEIRDQFRKLAREYHPDVNPGNKGAEDKFKELNEAYQVLSDPEKRQKYNQFGQQWQQYTGGGGRPENFDWGRWAGGTGGARRVSPEDLQDLFGGGGMGGFSDFFETLFGGAPGGQARRSRQAQNIEQPVEVTLEEAFQGCNRVFQREDGSRFEVKIPRGVRSGSKIRFAGKGASGMGNAQAGDLIVIVQTVPHPIFRCEKDDLLVTVQVDLYTALLGGEVQVPTLERPLTLKIPAGTMNGQTIRMRGQGMPHLKQPDKRGDILVKIEVLLPQNLTGEEKTLFEQLRKLRAR